MTWLVQLRTRFRGRSAILNNPRQRIVNCQVNLSGFPTNRLILDVDKLIANDPFVGQAIKASDPRCDLIVFFADAGNASVTLLEAKSNRRESYGDELKAVSQLRSSYLALTRALNSCSMNLPEFSFTGAIVTGSLNSGAWIQSDLRGAIQASPIDISVVPSGFDVYRQMFGRS